MEDYANYNYAEDYGIYLSPIDKMVAEVINGLSPAVTKNTQLKDILADTVWTSKSLTKEDLLGWLEKMSDQLSLYLEVSAESKDAEIVAGVVAVMLALSSAAEGSENEDYDAEPLPESYAPFPRTENWDVGYSNAGQRYEGTNSFQEGMAETPEQLSELSSSTSQRGRENIENFRARVEGHLIYTHNRKFPIDTGSAEARYVVLAEGSGAALYIDQMIDPGSAGATLDAYPSMSSHGDIGGSVIGAGAMKVSNGSITYISNKSGTWRPTGAHYAATLKLLLGMGLVKGKDLGTGKIKVAQWHPKPDGFDVDRGKLKTITLIPNV
ncbi:hypothetical protein [Streptomyces sp. NPDC126514]|uniref:hypothetical protein n=1 Tax=Streptomyces sp. NPDC126514 TaxID=3155210 RepID=UPI0033226EA2